MSTSLRHIALFTMATATAAASTACTLLPPAGGHPATRRHAASLPEPAPCRAVTLPVSTHGLQRAAGLATRFAAAYETRRPGEPPGTWLGRLVPMAASQLRATLARTAATPALWPARQDIAARAAAVRVRDLTPTSVTFTVRIVRTVMTPAGRSAPAGNLAVTVVRDGTGWAVYDVEPAAAGNSG